MRHYFTAVLEELESALLVAPLRRAREKVQLTTDTLPKLRNSSTRSAELCALACAEHGSSTGRGVGPNRRGAPRACTTLRPRCDRPS
jgi:hypothetical protein